VKWREEYWISQFIKADRLSDTDAFYTHGVQSTWIANLSRRIYNWGEVSNAASGMDIFFAFSTLSREENFIWRLADPSSEERYSLSQKG
jgi:hypothetical protein